MNLLLNKDHEGILQKFLFHKSLGFEKDCISSYLWIKLKTSKFKKKKLPHSKIGALIIDWVLIIILSFTMLYI